MLMYGNYIAARKALYINNIKFYNFTSLNEDFNIRLQLLPPNSLGCNSEYDFDVKYAQWILNNNQNFVEFMKIIMDIYNNFHIFIVISEDNWSTILVESLMKLIQQRYGLSSLYVNDEEDILFGEECEFDTSYGIANLDIDKQRYTELIEYQNYLMNGGIIPSI